MTEQAWTERPLLRMHRANRTVALQFSASMSACSSMEALVRCARCLCGDVKIVAVYAVDAHRRQCSSSIK